MTGMDTETPSPEANGDDAARLAERVCEARNAGNTLRIVGTGTKQFYGRKVRGEPLDVTSHRGIVNYEPTELVITARAGTPIGEIESVLAERNQILAFEPPHLGPGATLGGVVASGLSGPRRPYGGAVRDLVLGVRLINGKGEILRFGGQVMKNVAGYDVSRLMAGALGTLGILLDVSLKLVPRPDVERSLSFEMDAGAGVERMNQLAGQPLPLSAACHHDGRLHLRLSGSAGGVANACENLGGDEDQSSDAFWSGIREQTHPFFETEDPIWRISVPAKSVPLDLPGTWLVDWGGAQRWLASAAGGNTIRDATENAGGHATRYRGGEEYDDRFHPLSPGLLTLHKRLKQAFDPDGILNPGRMYADF